MRTVDWLTIAAILLGPILAVQITQWLDRKRDKRDRRIWIFQTLMTTRVTGLAAEHIRALNAIEIEFHGRNEADRRVVEAWRTYLAHLGAKDLPGEVWEAKRRDLFTELLHVLANVLGFPFDKSSIRNPAYYPIALSDFENDHYQIRKATLALLHGQIALPVYVPQAAATAPMPTVAPATASTPGNDPSEPSGRD